MSLMSCRYSACLTLTAPNIPWARTSEKPMIAFSGVRRRVLDRDDRLIGEGPEQQHAGVGERRHVAVGDVDDADHLPGADHRHPDHAPNAAGSVHLPDRGRPRGIGLVREVVARRELDLVTDEAVEAGCFRTAQAAGAVDDRGEHGLQVGGRSRDHAQDLARRGFPLEPTSPFVGLARRPISRASARRRPSTGPTPRGAPSSSPRPPPPRPA